MHPTRWSRKCGTRQGTSSSAQLGSIYRRPNLEKTRLIAAPARDRKGGTPSATTRHAEGRRVTDWLEELIAVPEREYTRFEAVLSLMGVWPDRVVLLLSGRISRPGRRDRAAIAKLVKSLRAFCGRAEIPRRLARPSHGQEPPRGHREGTLDGLEDWRKFTTSMTGAGAVTPTPGRGNTEPHPAAPARGSTVRIAAVGSSIIGRTTDDVRRGARDLFKTYPPTWAWTAGDVNAARVGLMGPNGAGKSTTVKVDHPRRTTGGRRRGRP